MASLSLGLVTVRPVNRRTICCTWWLLAVGFPMIALLIGYPD